LPLTHTTLAMFMALDEAITAESIPEL